MPSESPYDMLAAEYYNEHLHPTSAALRSLSVAVLRRLAVRTGKHHHQVLELGAGRSVLDSIALSFDRALLVDLSERMLRHSTRRPSQLRLNASAQELPVRGRSVDLVVSSLGDPYNDHKTWSEVRRSMRSHGYAVFTTPALEWTTWFRAQEGSSADVALFVNRHGKTIDTPSLVCSQNDQQALFDRAGLTIVYTEHINRASAGNLTAMAPKLHAAPLDTPLVYGYLVRQRDVQ